MNANHSRYSMALNGMPSSKFNFQLILPMNYFQFVSKKKQTFQATQSSGATGWTFSELSTLSGISSFIDEHHTISV